MIPIERCHDIVKKLIARSQQNQVDWIVKTTPGRRIYETRFANSAVRIEYSSPKAEADYITIEFTDPNRSNSGVVWRVISSNPEDEDAVAWAQWRDANSLFTEANRIATKWDIVLNDIEESLG
jgi:hypothetical protein